MAHTHWSRARAMVHARIAASARAAGYRTDRAHGSGRPKEGRRRLEFPGVFEMIVISQLTRRARHALADDFSGLGNTRPKARKTRANRAVSVFRQPRLPRPRPCAGGRGADCGAGYESAIQFSASVKGLYLRPATMTKGHPSRSRLPERPASSVELFRKLDVGNLARHCLEERCASLPFSGLNIGKRQIALNQKDGKRRHEGQCPS